MKRTQLILLLAAIPTQISFVSSRKFSIVSSSNVVRSPVVLSKIPSLFIPSVARVSTLTTFASAQQRFRRCPIRTIDSLFQRMKNSKLQPECCPSAPLNGFVLYQQHSNNNDDDPNNMCNDVSTNNNSNAIVVDPEIQSLPPRRRSKRQRIMSAVPSASLKDLDGNDIIIPITKKQSKSTKQQRNYKTKVVGAESATEVSPDIKETLSDDINIISVQHAVSNSQTRKMISNLDLEQVVSFQTTTSGASSFDDIFSGEVLRIVTPDPVLSNRRGHDDDDHIGIDTPSTTTKRILRFNNNDEDEYVDLCIPPTELRPSATLTTGQCFNWKAISVIDHDPSAADDATNVSPPTTKSAWGIHNATEWVGVLRVPSKWKSINENNEQQRTDDNNSEPSSSIVISIRETPTTALYKTLYAPSNVNVRDFLLSYFQVINTEQFDNTRSTVDEQQQRQECSESSSSLADLYEEWSNQCPRLRQIATCIPGVRVLDQDPWECFVSFLCSSNNNIPRITKILQSIRETYGEPLVVIMNNNNYNAIHENVSSTGDDSAMIGSTIYYSFPSFERLERLATEHDLRTKCGLGYRAKYLLESMRQLHALGGEQYLNYLKYNVHDPIQVQEALLHFLGIGRKVADCIALFSLHQDDAIPVDVHVWNIAKRDYDKTLRNHVSKSITPTLYQRIGDVFRTRFPTKSGWAHSLLFVAELPSFRPVLPEKIVQEMDKFKDAERRRKGL